jgi:hypothetical protein
VGFRGIVIMRLKAYKDDKRQHYRRHCCRSITDNIVGAYSMYASKLSLQHHGHGQHDPKYDRRFHECQPTSAGIVSP